MSTEHKAVKPNLFAIYRLEFYKNQSKWKFAKDIKKTVLPIKPETTSSTGSCVQTEEQEPKESPLNEAFVESEGSDKNLSLDSPDGVSPNTPDPEIKLTDPEIIHEQSLDLKWPEEQNATNWLQSRLTNKKLYDWSQMSKDCPDTQIWSQTPKDPANDWPQTPKNSPGCDWSQIPEDFHNCHIWSQSPKDLASESPQNVKKDLASEWPQNCNNDPGSGLPQIRTNAPRSEIWSDKQIVPEHASFEEGGDVEDGEDSAKVVKSAAEEWLLEPGWRQWLSDSSDMVSQDSIDEFMRGAHCAPHSSEMSLHVPADAPEPAQVSTGVLHACIRKQARVLRLLLREAARRDQLISTRYDTYDSFYEPRNRGVGLPPDFVAGSFRNHDEGQLCEVGRGRGRLQRRVVGIYGDRPFRLGQ